MKIGVLFTCYNCDSYVDESLSAWLKLKGEFDIVIAANSGMFKEYNTLGIPDRNQTTRQKLLDKKLDFLVTTTGNNLLDEDYSRDVCLDYLNGGRWKRNDGCDLLFVIDGDEIYTEENIRNILDFVMKNPDHQGYRVNYRNHTFRKGTFMYYAHDRVFWMKRHGGISRFYFDNQFEYVNHANGTEDIRFTDSLFVPPSVAFMDHYSWLSNDTRTDDKIQYQNFRYGGINNDVPQNARCSYIRTGEKLEFNPDYFSYRSLEIPILHEEIEGFPYSHNFRLDFIRSLNRIQILDVVDEMNINVEVYNDDTDEFLYRVNLKISNGQNFWISSGVDYNSMPNFKKFRVLIFRDDQLIHAEKIHIKQE